MKKQNTLAVLCATLGNVFWGFSFLLIRIAQRSAPSNVLLSHRFILSAFLMLLPLLIGKAKLSFKGKKLWPALLLMFFQVAYFATESYAIALTNSTISGLVLAVVPVVTIGTGALLLKEYPTKRQALFCLLPVAGVILMTVSGKELGVVSGIGIVFLGLMMLCSALYKTVNRTASREFSPYERTLIVLTASAVSFTVVALSEVGWDVGAYVAPLRVPSYTACLLSLSLLCSIAANLLVNYAVGKMSVFKVASFGSLSTLCTVIGGLLLREPFTWELVLGAGLIIVGIWQITRPIPQPKEVEITK